MAEIRKHNLSPADVRNAEISRLLVLALLQVKIPGASIATTKEKMRQTQEYAQARRLMTLNVSES